MSKKVLLIGCGQLGSRHLQAVASLSEVAEIHVVDPSPASIETARARFEAVVDRNPTTNVFWHTDLAAAARNGDLCIIPTQAKVRPALLKRVAAELGYENFLIEKIVAQSMGEFDDLLSFCEDRGLKVWVNCQTRTYEIHRRIKAILGTEEPVVMMDVGGNHGLACNGIHYADLFLFYDGGDMILPAGAAIDPVLHPSRRGGDIFDLSGTILAASKKGSKCVISYAAGHMSPDYVSISNSRHKFIVDHVALKVFESHADGNWAWKVSELAEVLYVSHLSKRLVRDILTSGVSELPTLMETRPSHQYILGELLPHFNRILGTKNDICPVT